MICKGQLLINKNLSTYFYFSWEKSGNVPILNSRMITRAIETNLKNMTTAFNSELDYTHILADILDTVEIPNVAESYNLPIQVILNLTQSTVNYFFACCKDDGKY